MQVVRRTEASTAEMGKLDVGLLFRYDDSGLVGMSHSPAAAFSSAFATIVLYPLLSEVCPLRKQLCANREPPKPPCLGRGPGV